MASRSVKLRPLRESVVIVAAGTTSPICVDVVSTWTEFAVTVTVSLCPPTSSVTSICRRLLMSTASPARRCGLNPSSVMVRSYRPTGTFGNEKVPWPSVTAVSWLPRAEFARLTVAPGIIAPLGSLIVPARLPPAWADAIEIRKSMSATARNTLRTRRVRPANESLLQIRQMPGMLLEPIRHPSVLARLRDAGGHLDVEQLRADARVLERAVQIRADHSFAPDAFGYAVLQPSEWLETSIGRDRG